jgi:hypothetical protein
MPGSDLSVLPEQQLDESPWKKTADRAVAVDLALGYAELLDEAIALLKQARERIGELEALAGKEKGGG